MVNVIIRYRGKDKADRATVEQVMDPRTRMILFKLLSRQVISEINGCISTGKEANVYHACSKDDKHYAIKVWLVFSWVHLYTRMLNLDAKGIFLLLY